MCRFQVKKANNKEQNQDLLKQLRGIPTGSIVFVKWYHRKSHKMFRTHGLLIAKRLKGFGSNIVLRTELCNEVINYYFKVYTPTFIDLGIIQLVSDRHHGKSKKYNLLDKKIKWKYL